MTVATQSGYISNQRLRQEFVRRRGLGWLTARDLAFRMGWVKGTRPDESRVYRVLGLSVSYHRSGRTYKQRTVSYEMAVDLSRAMNCDPWEVGL